MDRLSLTAAGVIFAVGSAVAGAAPPPAAPAVYNSGPFSPRDSLVSLSTQERAAFALLEGILQSAEGKVHATGCIPATLPLEVYSDALTDPVVGDATLGVAPNSLKLKATGFTPNFRGQIIAVKQDPAAGFINGTPVTDYTSNFVFNSANNMMVGLMTQVNVMSINWIPNQFTGYVIKDFYMGINEVDSHIVYDWGLQSLTKEGYPIEKYWQRSKVRRSDGAIGQTAFVKDRLVGVTKCRITAALSGYNAPDLFWQSGTLTISQASPGDPVPEFDAIPDI